MIAERFKTAISLNRLRMFALNDRYDTKEENEKYSYSCLVALTRLTDEIDVLG